jgi:hypothetical protein
MRNLLGGSAILETCLAKVNGKNVNGSLKLLEYQRLILLDTFASEGAALQNLPSWAAHA